MSLVSDITKLSVWIYSINLTEQKENLQSSKFVSTLQAQKVCKAFSYNVFNSTSAYCTFRKAPICFMPFPTHTRLKRCTEDFREHRVMKTAGNESDLSIRRGNLITQQILWNHERAQDSGQNMTFVFKQ